MKKYILIPALALSMVFSACSTVNNPLEDLVIDDPIPTEPVDPVSSRGYAIPIKLDTKQQQINEQLAAFSWKLFNECDIIWMEHDELKKRRPDRVMQHDNDLVVVDFKFGQPQEKYHRQVQGYMNLLRGMVGNENKAIRGYLWYVDNDKIERV